MVIEILISTMNRKDLSFLRSMFVNNNLNDYQLLIINQTSKDNILKSKSKNIRVINSFELGISKSRNLATKNAIGDICLIADDDVEYVKNFDKIIQNAYKKNVGADCIVFKAEIFNKKTNPKYLNQSKKIDKIKELEQVSSVEITFKRETVIKTNIFFNEHFGINSFFKAGEEWLFLNNIKKRGVIYFENRIILKHETISSGSKININSLMAIKSVQYHLIYPQLFYYYLIKLIIYLIYHSYISPISFLAFFNKGIKWKNAYMNIANKKI